MENDAPESSTTPDGGTAIKNRQIILWFGGAFVIGAIAVAALAGAGVGIEAVAN